MVGACAKVNKPVVSSIVSMVKKNTLILRAISLFAELVLPVIKIINF
jgi:hypothetical protein